MKKGKGLPHDPGNASIRSAVRAVFHQGVTGTRRVPLEMPYRPAQPDQTRLVTKMIITRESFRRICRACHGRDRNANRTEQAKRSAEDRGTGCRIGGAPGSLLRIPRNF